MQDETPAPDDVDPDTMTDAAEADTCDGKITLSDRGNSTYSWLYLTNTAKTQATLTIERSWMYQGRRRTDKKQHTLAPDESREVFSFPRNQSPRVSIVSCSLA